MRYAEIKFPDTGNGLGVRVSLWLQGCSHRCKGCFNPETWDPNGGMKYDAIANETIQNTLQYEYVQGASILGGEPLDQKKELESLLSWWKFAFPDKDIWLWTGYLWEDVKDFSVMQYIDVLVDGEFIEEQKDITLNFRGSRNQRVIDVQKSVKNGEVVLWEE